MKILVVTEWYPHEEDPAHGIFVRRQVEALTQHYPEIELCVVYARADDGVSDVEISHEQREGYCEYRVRYPVKRTMLGRFFCYRSSLKRAVDVIQVKWQSIDLCWCQVAWRSAILGRMLSEKYDVPYLITEHWTGYSYADGRYDQMSFVVRGWISRLYEHARSVVAVSGSQLQDIERHFHIADGRVIGNVVEPIDCRASKFERFTFLHISTLSHQKNVPLLLEAYRRHHEQHPDCQLIIVSSDDAARESTQKLVEDYGLTDSVELQPYQSPTDISRLLCGSHALLHTSRFESFSMVIAESWAAGLPTIATQCGGLTDDIPQSAGISVEAHTPEAVSDAMRYLRDHYGSYYPDAIRQFAAPYYSSEIAEAYYRLFEQLVD